MTEKYVKIPFPLFEELGETWRKIADQSEIIEDDTPPFPPIDPPGGDWRKVWVSSQSGHDDNIGSGPNTPVKTLSRALNVAIPGTEIVLMPGTYDERVSVLNFGTTKERPLMIRAQFPGTVEFVNDIRSARTKTANWQAHGTGIYFMNHQSEPWMGFAVERMLPRFKTFRDLSEAKADDVTMPKYGYFFDKGKNKLYVRLPGKENPNDHEVALTRDMGTTFIKVVNSPYVAIDGINFIGHGDRRALDFDGKSHHGWIQNCVSDLGRYFVQPSDDSEVCWNYYGYSGIVPWADELIRLNGGNPEALFKYVKKYNPVEGQPGNAMYEGRMAVGFRSRSTQRVKFNRNLAYGTFDSYSPGEFANSTSHGDVSVYAYDDGWQFESWNRAHTSNNLVFDRSVALNSFGSAWSHQDTARQMQGPHFVNRGIAYSKDPLARPPYLIKNMGMERGQKVNYDRCFLYNMSGRSGWGKDVNWIALDQRQGFAPGLKIRNSVVVVDKITDWHQDWDPDMDWCILASPEDYPQLRGPNGKWFKTVDELMLRDIENLDFRPEPGSPLLGAGEGGVDVGPYSLDEEMDIRPLFIAYTTELPGIWSHQNL